MPFFKQRSRLGLVTWLALIVLLPGLAVADPRDDKIEELQRQLEQQQQQIKTMQEAIDELRSQGGAPTPPPTTGEDEEDPGPEPPPPMQTGTTPASTTASGQQPSMNPNISVIGLMGGKLGGAAYDDLRNSFFLDEIEVALQAPIDPKARADIYLTFPNGEPPEVEEATFTWQDLPGGAQAKAGLLRADFGRINQLHKHAYPQIDAPLPNQALFGEEALRDPGVELSVLLPTSWYSRLSVQALSRGVGPDADGISALDLSTPVDQDTFNELLVGEDFSVFPAGGRRSLLYVGRLENLVDLDENTTLQLGLSAATSDIKAADLQSATAYGADLTLKWVPLDQNGKSLSWQTELVRARQNFLSASRDFGGWYSSLNYQFNRNWGAGLRYDETSLPFNPSLHRSRGTALL
ncbi:MAG: type II secretion system protein M, partial [Candidatus Eremiobacteraeota bacterium]|nr:type II secretion system protein M [Candidatus Eremiobacteraeota bacterium]